MTHHANIPVWEVEILIIGPISIKHRINFNARKELQHPEPFYSEISIINNKNGFLATVTAFTPNTELAEKAAIIFFRRMLDVLSLNLNIPLQLDIAKNVIVQKSAQSVRRAVDRDYFVNAFFQSRRLSLTKPTFLRSLSWFRKGKYSQDLLDKFLAFWNSIETVASKYNPNKDACKDKGSICHIWESFKKIWGECKDWEFIGGKTKWIDECNEHRKNIAHGIIPIEVDYIEKIVNKLPEVENIALKFLSNWKDTEINLEMTDDLIKQLK